MPRIVTPVTRIATPVTRTDTNIAAVASTDSGWLDLTTFTTGAPAGGDVIWANPGNAVSEDGVNSTYNVSGSPTTSEYLKAVNIAGSVPSDSTILGIEVRVKRKATFGSNTDHTVQLIIADALSGDNNADLVTTYGSSLVYISYGGSSDLWDNALTPAIINAADFGFVFRSDGITINSQVAVDHKQMKIHYSTPAATVNRIATPVTRFADTLFEPTLANFPALKLTLTADSVTGASKLTDINNGRVFTSSGAVVNNDDGTFTITGSGLFTADTAIPTIGSTKDAVLIYVGNWFNPDGIFVGAGTGPFAIKMQVDAGANVLKGTLATTDYLLVGLEAPLTGRDLINAVMILNVRRSLDSGKLHLMDDTSGYE